MQSGSVKFLGADGRPLMQASAYEAGDRFHREMRSWNPGLKSPDSELLPEMNTMVARTRDLVRNYGLASGAVQTHLDNVIGAGLRLSAKPDYRALGMDVDQAADWARDTESAFFQWAYDVDKGCDAGRRLNFAGMLGQGYRSYLTRGEIFAVAEWLPERSSGYATTIQMVGSERVSNPNYLMDGKRLRAGVALDDHGAAVAYHVRGDSGPGLVGQQEWKRIDAYTAWGRRQVLHIYDQEEAGQTRGKSNFSSVLAKMKMLSRFESVTLEAAVINSMFAAAIESDMGNVTEALGSGPGENSDLKLYANEQDQYGSSERIDFGGANIVPLLPNEKLRMVTPEHPSSNFDPFEQSFLRQLAGGLNLSYEQLSRDYSKTNYSGARAGLLESWKFFQGRRQMIGGELGTQIYALWLEEAMDRGIVSHPPGTPDYYEAKTAWTRCKWIGPGKSHIDPLKEGKADALALDRGFMTLEQACADRGLDLEEVLDQRAREVKMIEERGLALPGSIADVLGGPAEPETA